MPELLEVADLVAEFRGDGGGGLRAVDGVSFSVAAGTTMGLVGESGCGKSVTALSILKLLPSTARIASGQVRYLGEDLVAAGERRMQALRGDRIAMVFQEPMTSLNPVHTVGDQVGEPLRIHRRSSRADARRRAVELLAQVGIADPQRRASEYPHQLSGGMRQRVMIAMALACRPDLLIADEPTTALDVTIQAQILELLSRLRRETGMAMLLITHDLGVVAETCDEVAVMYAGQVVEQAKVTDLFARPRHPYTVGLLRSIPSFTGPLLAGPSPAKEAAGDGARPRRGRLPEIPGMVPALEEMPSACRFQDRCDRVAERCRKEAPPLVRDAAGAYRCFFPVGDLAS